MSIPKIIHYCWFGRKPLPIQAKKCIASWKRFCPDYQIVEWNEDNVDLSENCYVREAAELQKWAFVSDYVRLKIVSEQGGIYLDTDVELLRPLDPLLDYDGFMGFENRENVATGLGFGAVAGQPIIRAMREDYDDSHFIDPDGRPDITPCPERNTRVLVKAGLRQNNERQVVGGIVILPTEYLCPKDYLSGELHCTENTYSIHHYAGSWLSFHKIVFREIRHLLGTERYDWLTHNIVRIGNGILGKKR